MAKLQNRKILVNILVRLPVKSILQFRCVSKAWCKLLKHPSFMRKHLYHVIEMNNIASMKIPYPFSIWSLPKHCDLPPSYARNTRFDFTYPLGLRSDGITIWGNCNGLMCSSGEDDDFIVLNPSIKEHREVPSVPIESLNDISYFKYGFGYDLETDEFKVVCVAGFEDECCCEVQVYTLASNSWRRIENIPYYLDQGQPGTAHANVNYGTMHWLATTDPLASEPYKVILSFDFKDDRFDEWPLPSFRERYEEIKLCALGGSLCLIGNTNVTGVGRIDVWEMKEYGVTESWDKLFCVSHRTIRKFSEYLFPLHSCCLNYEILLGFVTGDDDSLHLDLYDPENATYISQICSFKLGAPEHAFIDQYGLYVGSESD